MKRFRFDRQVGHEIKQYESINAAISRIVRTQGPVSIGCIRIGPKGVLGYHPAVVDQLFLVVEGEGWVRGKDDSEPVPISAGQAAFWEAGEGHESGSEEGMIAMVIEGEKLNPESYMPLLG
ncbi:cupin domain-containing protein [Brevibacillus panacihumi]|uniref:cupin domain-containing protein n=1 Tax=Brevibacillus panacihumi TaxID=497735 RepID=UPI00040EA65A|nr:hypothetical protein [Brevibacillus panacihumi]